MRPRWPIRVFFALLAVVYLTVFPYMAHINNPNENVRTYMTMALVEDHTFCVDRIVERHGHTNDMALVPDPKSPIGGHRYSVKAPYVSYAGVPVYWAFTKIAPVFGTKVPSEHSPMKDRADWLRASTFVLRLFVVQIPCLLFLVWFERFLRAYSDDKVLRLTAVAAAGLGTNYLAYALMNVSHALFAVAAFGAFAITTTQRNKIARARDRSIGHAFLAGFLAGGATLLEYHALPVSFVLALYAAVVFFSPKRLLALAIGGGINVGALMLFQWRSFGSPLTPGHKMVENQFLASRHHEGLFGMETPSWEVFRDISISRAFGFFGTSPYMWLGLLAVPVLLFFPSGTPRVRRQLRIATFVWALTMLIMWVTVSAANNWRGGWTIGPRYLGAAPPFFAFGAVCLLERFAGRSTWRRAMARGAAGGLAAMAAVQTGLISLLYNSMPEEITRPLPQMAIPMLRTGFIPYDLAEIVGWQTTYFFYFVVACLLAAPLLAAMLPARQRLRSYVPRIGAFAVAFAAAWFSAVSPPDPDTEGVDWERGLRGLTAEWEPAGRDRIARLKLEAQRYGPRGPCLWYKLADLERIVHWDGQAAADEHHVAGSRASCP
jgi:hypothetical protein